MTVEPRERSRTLQVAGRQAPPAAASRAGRRAWLYLWAAFGIWCVLVAYGLYVGNTWRKTSYLSPPAQLVAKQGIVLYQGPRDALPVSVAEGAELVEGGLIDVPSGSEAIVKLRVENSTVRLRSNTQVRLTTMRVGRFQRELTEVKIDQLRGAANYQVAGELPDGREVEIQTPNTPGPDDSIKLIKGEYLVWVQPGGTRLSAYLGQARAEIDGFVFRLRERKWVVLGPERPDMRVALDLPERLVKNRDFGRGLTEFWLPIDIGEKGRPDIGGQRSLNDLIINGQLTKALHLTRDTTKDTHNETGLRQDITKDVWAYRSVTLSAWVKVNSASLDGGGYAGSEYPLMFRINYIAENGGEYTSAHGFYYRNDTNRPADLGQQIPQGEWTRFTLDLNSLRERPAHLLSLEVLASGHDYDAEVSGIDLTVE
jgi:hypothetical protein